jgi:hypothetical protein
MLEKMSLQTRETNLFKLPKKRFTLKQIQNADKLHASLKKAGLEGCYNPYVFGIIIKSRKDSSELLEILNDGTKYVDWELHVQDHRDYEGNAIVFLS